MKNRSKTILICGASLALLGAVGCSERGTIRAAAIDGVMQPVLDRHDAYVENDDSLAPVQTETYLRSSAQLRGAIDDAMGRTADAEGDGN